MQKDIRTEVSSMSKLNIDQKTIKLLLTDKHSDFLIPDYQRPYAWAKTSVQRYGTISSPSRFPTTTATPSKH